MNMMGLCGDNCEYCPRYIATQNGGGIEFEKVKELWVRLGFRDHFFLPKIWLVTAVFRVIKSVILNGAELDVARLPAREWNTERVRLRLEW